MSEQHLIEAVAAQVAAVASKEGRTHEEVLEDMQRYLLKERMHRLASRNRLRAEALGIKESDIDDLKHEARLGR